MKALRVRSGSVSVDDVAVPHGGSESLVRVLRSGICNTDLEIARGYAGFEGTIGHEFVGVVEASPDRHELIGKRVVGEINAGCGHCELCIAGDSRHCPGRTVLGIKGRNGAHAEFLVLPTRNLIEVPESISDEDAVFVEPLAAAFGITERVSITSETHVAVIGDGKLGLLCAFSLALKTKNIALIGKHAEKLELATKNGRDIEVLDLSQIANVRARYDVVVEASGSESGFSTALDLVKSRGKIVLKSTFQGNPAWQAFRIVVDEITVVGSRCGRFEAALHLLAEKKVRVDDLISERFDLTEGVEAMKEASKKGVLKVLLSMER